MSKSTTGGSYSGDEYMGDGRRKAYDIEPSHHKSRYDDGKNETFLYCYEYYGYHVTRCHEPDYDVEEGYEFVNCGCCEGEYNPKFGCGMTD